MKECAMKEHETQEHLSSHSAEGPGYSEEGSGQLEESLQRRGGEEASCLLRNEKIRLIALGLALLALLAGFLLYLLSRSVLPLFGTMVFAYLGYRRFDAWLNTPEPSKH